LTEKGNICYYIKQGYGMVLRREKGMDRRKKQELKKAGFTILELMVVLAIIAIGSTIAVSSYIRQLEEIRVKGDVRALEQNLQLAKMRAISTGTPHGIAFDRRTGAGDKARYGQYFIFMDNAPPPSGDGKFTDPDNDPTNNNDPESATDDFIPMVRGDTFIPERLSRNNNFTCIFNSTAPSGTDLEFVLFDSMGRATPNVGNKNFIGIQREPEIAGESRIRGLVFVHLNTGLTESIPSQNFSTNQADWCTR
jgi:prepilin-type N-terminal cleavage/methylation domain-containing protein